jgi:hypothetical protein
MPTVVGRSIKCVVPLDPETVLNVHCPEGGSARTLLTVKVGNQTVSADVASKAIRKAQATIREGDAVCFLQGKLNGTRLEEVGIVAQAMQPKPEPAEAA